MANRIEQDFDRQQLLHLARTMQQRAEQTIANTVQRIRPGAVAAVDEELRIADVLLDGELSTSPVVIEGTTVPAVGDRVHVLVDTSKMSILLGIGGGGTTTAIVSGILPTPTTTAHMFAQLPRVTIWGHSWLDSVGVGGTQSTDFNPPQQPTQLNVVFV